jgi:MFS family permease
MTRHEPDRFPTPGIPLRPPGLQPAVPSRSVSRPTAFWALAVLLLLVLASSGAATPLYRIYQQQFGFSSGVLTLVFGIYAFALLAALLVVGSLSDHIGRRPVLTAALLLHTAAMVLFLVADGVPWLLAARVVQGLSTGALTGVVGAALLDFQRRDKPIGALMNSVSRVGLALGAVGAGLLAQLVAAPTTWMFAFLTGFFLLAAGGVLLLPESAPRVPGALASLRPQVHVPPEQWRPFVVVLPCVIATWALSGLYFSLGPSLAADVFGIDNHLVGALILLALNGTAAVGSLTMKKVAAERTMVIGALVFSTGVAGNVMALSTGSVPLFFAAAMVSGFGFGSAFFGALATVTQGVAPGKRAGLLSSIFVVGYLSFSLPAMAAGLATDRFGLATTAEVYGVVVVLLAFTAVTALQLRRRTDA